MWGDVSIILICLGRVPICQMQCSFSSIVAILTCYHTILSLLTYWGHFIGGFKTWLHASCTLHSPCSYKDSWLWSMTPPSYYNHQLKFSMNFIFKLLLVQNANFFTFNNVDADEDDATVFLWAMFLVLNEILILIYIFFCYSLNKYKEMQTN